MNILFFAKPKKHTLECLKFLWEQNETILGVVICDRMRFETTDFYCFCKEKNIRIYDSDEIYTDIKELENKLDVIFVNTYPHLIKSELINVASKGAYNFHAAPLPEYRGVFGFNFVIYNMETQYGVTAHRLSEKFDEGDIVEVDRFNIDSASITVQELVSLAENHLLDLFKKTYFRIRKGEKIICQKQCDGKYYSRKDFEKLKEININDPEDIILRKIRAFWYPPYEGAYISLGGKKYYLNTEEMLRQLTKGAKIYER